MILLGSIEFTGINSQQNLLISFAGMHSRGADSLLCPTGLRPLLESHTEHRLCL
jgi:hypothetical protein